MDICSWHLSGSYAAHLYAGVYCRLDIAGALGTAGMEKNKLLYQTMAILAGISGAWLIAMMTIVCGQIQTQGMLHLLIPGVFAGWLLTMYTIRVFLSCQWKSMGKLVSDMDKVSRGVCHYAVSFRRA